MRLKISFENPLSSQKENILIAVSNSLTTIQDLENHILEKIGLEDYVLRNKKTICLKLNGYLLPKTENIKGLIQNDDLLK
jgi:hypothetical protein